MDKFLLAEIDRVEMGAAVSAVPVIEQSLHTGFVSPTVPVSKHSLFSGAAEEIFDDEHSHCISGPVREQYPGISEEAIVLGSA